MATLVCFLSAFAIAPTQCPDWSSEFHSPGVDGAVYTVLSTDFGGAPLLIIAGRFEHAGDLPADNVAAWDGNDWSALGDGLPGDVRALCVYNDGTSEKLYAAGSFSLDHTLASFDGSSWTLLDIEGDAQALAVFDEGNGEALFIGGDLRRPNSPFNTGLLRYTAAGVSEVAGGIPLSHHTHGVRCLTVWDDGGGGALYAGGTFDVAGAGPNSVPAANIARWDGTAWSSLGGGLTSGQYSDVYVSALRGYDDGSGSRLFAGGEFERAGGAFSNGLARWTGAAWESLSYGNVIGSRNGFGVHDSGNGPRLFVATSKGVFRYSFQQPFTELSGLGPTSALASFDDGSGAVLYAGSTGDHLGRIAHNGITRWRGMDWETLDDGLGVGGGVVDIIPVRLGGSSSLWVAGSFSLGAGEHFTSLARWNGSWSALPAPGTSIFLNALIEHDDGSGAAVYACGRDVRIDGIYPPALRYDGAMWYPVGTSITNNTGGECWAVFDEGSGPNLFMGGKFSTIDGQAIEGVARWDGSVWSAVGGGVDYHDVAAMLVFDDGSGPALFVAGAFNDAGGVPVNHIARWDGIEWSDVGGGMLDTAFPSTPVIQSLTIFDDGAGPKLIAGGRFDNAGGSPAGGIAAWDGTSWATYGTGLTTVSLLKVEELTVHDPDGRGDQLWVAGRFDSAGGVAVQNMARFDGTSWFAAGGTEGKPKALASYDDGTGRALYVGGGFSSFAGLAATGFTRLTDPCGFDLGHPVCGSSSNSSGARAILRAAGSSSVAANDVTVAARDLPAGAPTLFFAGKRGINVPFGDGRRCAAGSTRRIGGLAAADSSGEHRLTLDLAAPYATGFVNGSNWTFQAWFRDTIGGSSGFNLTDGLSIEFRP